MDIYSHLQNARPKLRYVHGRHFWGSIEQPYNLDLRELPNARAPLGLKLQVDSDPSPNFLLFFHHHRNGNTNAQSAQD